MKVEEYLDQEFEAWSLSHELTINFSVSVFKKSIDTDSARKKIFFEWKEHRNIRDHCFELWPFVFLKKLLTLYIIAIISVFRIRGLQLNDDSEN